MLTFKKREAYRLIPLCRRTPPLTNFSGVPSVNGVPSVFGILLEFPVEMWKIVHILNGQAVPSFGANN